MQHKAHLKPEGQEQADDKDLLAAEFRKTALQLGELRRREIHLLRRVALLELERSQIEGALELQKERQNAALTEQAAGAENLRRELAVAKADSERLRAELARVTTIEEGLKAELTQKSAESNALRSEIEQLKAIEEELKAELIQKSAESNALRSEIERLKAIEEGLKAELTQKSAESNALRSEIEQLKAIEEGLKAELTQKSAESNALRSELMRTSEESTGHQTALAHKTAEIEQLKASTSWRITKPLRWTGERFPGPTRHARRAVKLAWWALTFQLTSRLRDVWARRLQGKLIASSEFFDRDWYLDRYPDVRAAAADPALHYLNHGASEGRNPSALFDTEWYLGSNPDVRKAGVNPLVHYLQHGKREGRISTPPTPAKDLPSGSREVTLPPALERLLHSFHDPGVIPTMLAIYDALTRHESNEISKSDLGGLADVQALVSEATGLARAKAAASQFDASVIVPAHNKLIHTLCCLKALLIGSTRSSFEVIVADDVSTDATPAVIGAIGGVVRFKRNAENLGFTRNCNRAAASARGEIVVILNNDTIPLPGWLDELVATLRRDASIGLVGSKLVNADGSLQEAGGIVWRDGSASNFGRGQDATAPQYNCVKEVDFVSAASIAVPKPVWDRLGGFDELFVPACCEDMDLAFRVRALGLRTVYQPLSAVVHHEGINYGRHTSSGIKAYQVRNSQRFFDRWSVTLSAEKSRSEHESFVGARTDGSFQGRGGTPVPPAGGSKN
jgi:GT2 family glycosyltransferase